MMSSYVYSLLIHAGNVLSYFGSSCSSQTGVDCGDTGLPRVHAGGNQLEDILRIVFAVLGALAVLFIILAGFRFITAQGNPQEISKAKSTIMYALVGLVVALLAEGLVALTLGKLG